MESRSADQFLDRHPKKIRHFAVVLPVSELAQITIQVLYRNLVETAYHAALFPDAHTPILNESGLPTGIAENRSPASQPTNEYFWVVRVDQSIGNKDALFGRYTFDDASQTKVEDQPNFPQLIKSRQQYFTLAETHFFSPSLLNTVRLGYTRPVMALRTDALIPIDHKLFFVSDAPQFGSMLVSGLTMLGPMYRAPWSKVMNSYQVADDLIYSRGSHTWKVGFLADRYQWNGYESANRSAWWRFSSLESFLAGGPKGSGTRLVVALSPSDAYRAFRQSLFGSYVQDDYKLRANLTLNLGLRYEFTTKIQDKQSRKVYLQDEVRDTQPQLGALMSRNPSLLNFAPRIGLNWSPGNAGRTFLRAGFGIYYDPIIQYAVDAVRTSFPFYKRVVLPNLASQFFPNAEAAAAGVDVGRLNIMEYNDPKQPTVYRYHFSLEHELFSGLRLNAMYVGARGNHLLRTIEVNQFPFAERKLVGTLFFPPDPDPDPKLGPNNTINPAFGSIEKTQTDGQSFYNAVVLSVNQRNWKGLSWGGNYTFSKSVDDVSDVGGAFDTQYGLDRKENRGLSDFDIRHNLAVRYFYAPPFGPGHRWLSSGWFSHIFGGWRLGGIVTGRSGRPFSPVYSVPYDGYLMVAQRPNRRPDYSSDPTKGITAGCSVIKAGRELGGPDLYFDPCAFEVPAPGTIGNVGRNTIRGPRVVNMDFSLQKEFAIDSQRWLEFRTEIFNLPNHPNFQPPPRFSNIFRSSDGRLNPNAGRLSSTSTTPRQIQFALRLSF